MPPKAMMAVSRLVIRPLRATNKRLSRRIQNRRSRSCLQLMLWLAMQQVMQLRAPCGVAADVLRNEISYFLIRNQTINIGAIAPVVSLSAYLHELASPADAQVLDAFLREDLPGRFFTTDRP